jgi:hypothetical protein
MPAWLALLGTPLISLGHLGAVYALVTPSCSQQTTAALHTVSVVSLAACAVLAWLALRRIGPAGLREDGGDPAARASSSRAWRGGWRCSFRWSRPRSGCASGSSRRARPEGGLAGGVAGGRRVGAHAGAGERRRHDALDLGALGAGAACAVAGAVPVGPGQAVAAGGRGARRAAHPRRRLPGRMAGACRGAGVAAGCARDSRSFPRTWCSTRC